MSWWLVPLGRVRAILRSQRMTAEERSAALPPKGKGRSERWRRSTTLTEEYTTRTQMVRPLTTPILREISVQWAADVSAFQSMYVCVPRTTVPVLKSEPASPQKRPVQGRRRTVMTEIGTPAFRIAGRGHRSCALPLGRCPALRQVVGTTTPFGCSALH